MIVNNTNKTSPLMTRRIIWGAMLQGVVMLCAVLGYLRYKTPVEHPLEFGPVKYFLLIVPMAVLFLDR